MYIKYTRNRYKKIERTKRENEYWNGWWRTISYSTNDLLFNNLLVLTWKLFGVSVRHHWTSSRIYSKFHVFSFYFSPFIWMLNSCPLSIYIKQSNVIDVFAFHQHYSIKKENPSINHFTCFSFFFFLFLFIGETRNNEFLFNGSLLIIFLRWFFHTI